MTIITHPHRCALRLGACLEGFQMRHACTHERTRISAPDPLMITEHCLECPAYRVLFSARQMYALEKAFCFRRAKCTPSRKMKKV